MTRHNSTCTPTCDSAGSLWVDDGAVEVRYRKRSVLLSLCWQHMKMIFIGAWYLPKKMHLEKKLYQHRPPIAKNNFFHQCREQCHVCKKLKAAFLDAFSGCHCCVRCHGHPAMERPLPQSWSSPSPSPTIALYNGTLQWHPAMAPRPLPQSWSSPSPPTIAHYSPPPTIAHYNGTQQWHHVHSSWSSPSPPTIAHYNGTLRWHPAMAPRPLP